MGEEIDVDGSGMLDITEVEGLSDNVEAMRVFDRMGISCRDTWRFFDLIDVDKSRTLSQEEFVSGCIWLSGTSNNTNMAVLLENVNKLLKKVSRLDTAIRI